MLHDDKEERGEAPRRRDQLCGLQKAKASLSQSSNTHLTEQTSCFLHQDCRGSHGRIESGEEAYEGSQRFLCAKKHKDSGEVFLSPVDLPWQPVICCLFVFQVLVKEHRGNGGSQSR